MPKAVGAAFCRVFFIILFFLAFSKLSAIQYWGDGVFADFGYSSGSTAAVPLEGTFGIRHSVPKASFFVLGGLNGFSADFSFSARVEPVTAGIFSLGFGYLFHVSRAFPDAEGLDFYEYDNNFYLSFIFRGKNTVNPVKTILSIGIDAKTSVFNLSQNKLVFTEAFPALEVQVQKRFLKQHEIMFRFATFDYVYFKAFLNTWWQVGYSYDINRLVTVGGLFEISYADQFSNSGTFSGFQVKIFAVYKL